MKHFIYLKPCRYIQLAHLYEHLFAIEFNKTMRDRGLYQHVDYALIPKTYHGGLIYMEIFQYHDMGLKLADVFDNLELNIDCKSVNLAMRQIMAESGIKFSGNMSKIIKMITALHREPWQNIDDFSVLDAKLARRRLNWPLVATGEMKPSKLEINIIADDDLLMTERTLLPLFRQISYVVATNLADVLCDNFGLFCEDIYFDRGKLKCLMFGDKKSICETQSSDIKIYVDDIAKSGALVRMVEDLVNMSYVKMPDQAVNFENNFEDTLIFLGSRGWKEISTVDNLATISKGVKIEVRVGDRRDVIGY